VLHLVENLALGAAAVFNFLLQHFVGNRQLNRAVCNALFQLAGVVLQCLLGFAPFPHLRLQFGVFLLQFLALGGEGGCHLVQGLRDLVDFHHRLFGDLVCQLAGCHALGALLQGLHGADQPAQQQAAVQQDDQHRGDQHQQCRHHQRDPGDPEGGIPADFADHHPAQPGNRGCRPHHCLTAIAAVIAMPGGGKDERQAVGVVCRFTRPAGVGMRHHQLVAVQDVGLFAGQHRSSHILP